MRQTGSTCAPRSVEAYNQALTDTATLRALSEDPDDQAFARLLLEQVILCHENGLVFREDRCEEREWQERDFVRMQRKRSRRR